MRYAVSIHAYINSFLVIEIYNIQWQCQSYRSIGKRIIGYRLFCCIFAHRSQIGGKRQKKQQPDNAGTVWIVYLYTGQLLYTLSI